MSREVMAQTHTNETLQLFKHSLNKLWRIMSSHVIEQYMSLVTNPPLNLLKKAAVRLKISSSHKLEEPVIAAALVINVEFS